MKMPIGLTSLALIIASTAFSQSAQTGMKGPERGAQKLRVDYVHYRPAVFETEQFKEAESEHLNKGGLLYVYYTNVSDQPVNLRFYRLNGKDTSYWRLNGFVAWDRNYNPNVAPGQSGVWEIDGVTEDFAAGKPCKFSLIDHKEGAVGKFEMTLEADPVQVTHIRVLPGMKELEIHVRNAGKDTPQLGAVEIAGAEVASCEWAGQELPGPGHAIAHVTLAAPATPASLLIVKIPVKGGGADRTVCGHRRAFEDVFPIGTWNSAEENLPALRRMHVDTGVSGGKKTDKFFAELAPKYGHNAIVHTEVPTEVDTLRELTGHPNVLCWGLADEPDWSTPPNVMLLCEQMVRKYDSTKPSFMTLCRDIKFFEYAPITDIACQDHYCVTAPSSSIWKKFYGTRLEETQIYTRDLKRAAEPKPIWVWTQGIAGWGERPKRTVPTPDELAGQLVLNLGQGAKGILWFNYGRKEADKFPDAVDAMRMWGRVMCLLRQDFLASDPALMAVKAPEKIDVAPLASRDKLLLCLFNTDYDVDPQAYPWREKKDVKITVELPSWINPAAALRITPEGVIPADLKMSGREATISMDSLRVCDIIMLPNAADAKEKLDAAFKQIVADEDKTY